MLNLGDISAISINGNELVIKDAEVRGIVNEIIEAIGANNSNITARINDLHNRSFDYTLDIVSVNDSELASIQDGVYKLHYVTITNNEGTETKTLNDSAILVQSGINQYLYRNGQISFRVKNNNTWGNWILKNVIKLNSEYPLSTQLTSQNTTYIIYTNIDLNSNTITIPNNCTLNFQGGSISNGTVTLQNTKLKGDVKFTGVTISGSCTNEILTPQMFGAYPSLNETESNKTQHTLGFQNLVRVIENQNTVSKTVYISAGHYAINDNILFMKSVTVYGNGNTTIIDIYDGSGRLGFGYTTTGNHYYDSCETLNCTITEDAPKLQDYIIVDDTSELSIGDYLIITDSKDSSFNKSRTYFRSCEFIQINNIEENRVTLTSKLYGHYYFEKDENYVTTLDPEPTNRIVISKFVPQEYNIHDLKIISHEHLNETPSAYYSLIICGFKNSNFKNIEVENHGNYVPCCIKLGINAIIDNCIFRGYATYTTDSYGLAINNMQDYIISNSTFRAVSHALTTGGGSSVFDTINRNFIYENLYFEHSQYNSNLSSYGKIDLDVHGDSENYKFFNINCPHIICDTGGYNVTIDSCKFYKITTSFNESDANIINCEIFTEEPYTLQIWNENAYEILGNNAIIFENNKIHCDLTIDGQSSNKIYDNIIFKNNVCKSFKLRNSIIKNVIVENNSFGEGGIFTSVNCIFNNTSFKHNTFLDGYLWIVSQELGDCIISDNYIKLKTLPTSAETQNVYLSKVNGYFTNNIVIREINNYHTPIVVYYSTSMKINNNIIKVSEENTSKELVASSRGNVILQNNIHNSTSNSLIQFADGTAGEISFGFSDYYKDLNSNYTNKCAVKDAIGKTFYNEKTNRLGYASIVRTGKPKSGTISVDLMYISSLGAANEYYIIENVFDTNNFYFTSAESWGEHKLYFSKTNDTTDENFENQLLFVSEFSYTEKMFQAPNKTDYPYVVIVPSKANISMRFWYSRIASDFDGAAFNVKRIGTTAERPAGYDIYQGFAYLDTDLGKTIYAKTINTVYFTVTWVESDGAIAGVKRIGTTSERPTGTNIYVGFKYIDTDLGKEIYASAISGSTVTWNAIN